MVIEARDFTADELGTWGMRWEPGTFTGFVDGEKVIEKHFVDDPVATKLTVAADASAIGLNEDVRVMVRVLDQAGNKLPFFMEPVEIAIDGPARLAGPKLVALRGGSIGFWLRSTGPGTITASVTHQRLGTVSISLEAEEENAA